MSDTTTNKVWKFLLPRRDVTVELPWGSEVLSVSFQPENGIVLYANVPQNRPAYEVSRRFLTVPTGEPFTEVPFNTGFIGTVTDPDGLVFHVFEVQP